MIIKVIWPDLSSMEKSGQITLIGGPRCCATNRKVAVSIPAGAIGIFH